MTDLKDIAIRHIQDYLQGTKTIHELKLDLDKTPEFRHIPDTVDLPNKLLTQVNLGAYNCDELFDLPNSAATRHGLIHMLESYLTDNSLLPKLTTGQRIKSPGKLAKDKKIYWLTESLENLECTKNT